MFLRHLAHSSRRIIVYLPEFELYADPTVSVSFVGRLPQADRGKRVLRVSKRQVTMAQTPIGTADESTPLNTNVSYLFGPLTRNRVYNAMCQPGLIVKDVSIELPDGIAPKELPNPVHASTGHFEFKREWSLHEQTIVQHSELRSTVGGAVCSPEMITAIANAVNEISNRVDPILSFEPSSLGLASPAPAEDVTHR